MTHDHHMDAPNVELGLFTIPGYVKFLSDNGMCDPELLREEYTEPGPDGTPADVDQGDLRVSVKGETALGGFWTEAPNPALPKGQTKALLHMHYDLDFDPATSCPTFEDGDPEAAVESWLDGTDIFISGMAWWTTVQTPRFKTVWVSVRTNNERGEHHIREHMANIQPPDDPQDWRWDIPFILANVLGGSDESA